MAIKNWMVVQWSDLKDLPKTGSTEPISPRGKLIIDENTRVEWEKEGGETAVVAYYRDIPVGFGPIVDGIAIVYCSPVGNATYGHGCKKRAEEAIATLQSAFQRYAPKETRSNDSGWSKPKKTRKKSSAGEVKDQTPSYKRRKKQNSGWNNAGAGHMALHQVCKHEREGCWCTIKATGKRYWRSGGTVRGHWRGEGADKLNAKL